MSEGTKRNISVVKDADGNKIVVINDIIFKGKKIAWDDVEKYLRKYVGEVYSQCHLDSVFYNENSISYSVMH